MKNIALLGCGNLGRTIALSICGTLSDAYQLCAVADADPDKARALSKDCGCAAAADVNELLNYSPELVIEATNPTVLQQAAALILSHNADLIPLSVGALADGAFYQKLWQAAAQAGRHVYLPSGSLGGFDVMQATALMGAVTCEVCTEKAPASLARAAQRLGLELNPDQAQTVFSGSAAEGIVKFPRNVNIAVAAGLASCGPEQTTITLRSVPGLTSTHHQVRVYGETVQFELDLRTKPSPDNPSSSSLAALSVIALLHRLSDPISFI